MLFLPDTPADAIVPVPPLIKRRAWEAAFMAGGEHSARFREALGESDGVLAWHWALAKVEAGPDGITWASARDAFALYRHLFPRRAA